VRVLEVTRSYLSNNEGFGLDLWPLVLFGLSWCCVEKAPGLNSKPDISRLGSGVIGGTPRRAHGRRAGPVLVALLLLVVGTGVWPGPLLDLVQAAAALAGAGL
jgi:hypothetical protein